MNISQLIIGLIFLINPNINIVDLLPDAVGIALIISAISKPALVYDCMYSTKLSFQKLLYVEIAKAAALILLPISDDTMVLTLTFAFLILELIFAPNAFYKLLDSIVYTGSLNNSSSVFKNLTDTKVMCMVFVIARPILNVIPEFTALAPSSNEYVYSGVAAETLQQSKSF